MGFFSILKFLKSLKVGNMVMLILVEEKCIHDYTVEPSGCPYPTIVDAPTTDTSTQHTGEGTTKGR